MSMRDELKIHIIEHALKTGDFTLASGKKSDYYINGKLSTLDARGSYLIARVFLAMIADDYGERVVSQPEFLKPLHEAADLLVDEGNLAIVRPIGVGRAKGFGWRVGLMRVEQMHPCQERRARRTVVVGLQPGQRRINDRVRRSFGAVGKVRRRQTMLQG